MCGYVLRNQGVEYVKEVCLKFQKLSRPRLTHPSNSNAAIKIKEILNGQILDYICAKMTDPQVKNKEQ